MKKLGFYMLMFELGDWSVLKNIFININEIIDEIVIQCDEEGFKFNAIDRSHVCFFKCVISKELFDKYEILQPLELYISLDDLVKVLKRGNNKDDLIFRVKDGQYDVIFKNKNIREFKITPIDLEDNSRDLPVLEYSVSFDCDFDFLKNALKDADLYSDKLTFNCNDNLLILSCDGLSGGYKNRYFLEKNFDIDCTASFSVSWLFKILNNKLGSNLKINMGDDFPMLIEMGLDNILMNYILAPRLDEGG